jgi:hypothetical protein
MEDKMKKIIPFFVIFLQIGFIINAQSITINDYINHLMHYFESKNDEIILETLEIYTKTTQDEILDRIDEITIFFFYGIKKDNPERYNEFLNTVNKSKNQRLINVFKIVETNDLELYLVNHEIVPQINDNYWTLYFSSGNTKYLDAIIDFINKYNNETDNIMSYMTARSGIWSFMLNIRTCPSVLNYIRNNQKLASGIKNTILNKTIEDLEKETNEYLRQQKEKGIW